MIADELRKQGADVTEVVAYRTVAAEPEREGEPDIYRMLLERRIDVVTFTSAVGGAELRRGCSARSRPPTCCGRRVVASIGPVTAEAAAQCGIQTTIMPAQYTIPALVDAIVRVLREAADAQPDRASRP